MAEPEAVQKAVVRVLAAVPLAEPEGLKVLEEAVQRVAVRVLAVVQLATAALEEVPLAEPEGLKVLEEAVQKAAVRVLAEEEVALLEVPVALRAVLKPTAPAAYKHKKARADTMDLSDINRNTNY